MKQQSHTQFVDELNDVSHQLWLTYSQLKDAESTPDQRLELLEHSREELERQINRLNKMTLFARLHSQMFGGKSE